MIKVLPQNPPLHYEAQVRIRGSQFLASHASPTRKQWKEHSYWRIIHDDLYQLNNGICAYSATWTPRSVSNRDSNQMTSIDHFIPKGIVPSGAYEWSNFRLCKARINNNKADSLEIIDPLYITGSWFVLDFYTFLVDNNTGLPTYLESRVKRTIEILDLNNNDFVEQRIDIIRHYVLGTVTFAQLESKYPFVAHEMTRQNFDANFGQDMRDGFLGI